MNFYVDSGGVVLHVDPERIFQGSANANTIRFVGAFASNLSVTTAFKLPNGVWTVPQKMTLSAQLPGIQMPDGTQFNTWEYKIPATVTENYGAVNVQFFVYGDTGGTGGQIASAMSSFEVEKGVPITLPDPTDDYNTLLTQILSTLSQLQGFYDDLNIDLEQLQTSVRGLQDEVSGIQIDLEQVHTDLGNRVEKTTLTYSLYGTDKNGNQAIIPYGTTGLGNSIPQYTADSEIRIPASPTQSYYAANKGYVDAGLEEKLDKTGGEINGDLLVGGELRVLDDTIIIGNLTVHGTTITEDAETIMSKANVIVTNSEGAPLTQLSGIGIRTNATLVYGIMYDPGDDTVKLGEGTLNANNEFTFNSGEGTAVATRADSAMWTNGHLSMWNAAEYRFVDSGIAANNVVTVNTTQQIEGVKSFSNPVYISDGTSRYTAEYSARYITAIDEPAGTTHTYNFPQGTGTLALTSDIPTDYVTEKEFSNLAQQVEDLYALGEQGGLFTVTTVEDTYTTRETADGNLNIADGVSTIVKTIEGSTVKTTNLIDLSDFSLKKTVNGITFTKLPDGQYSVTGTIVNPSQGTASTITINSGKIYPAGVYSTARYIVDGKDIEFFVTATSAITGVPIRNIDNQNITINEEFVIVTAGIYVNRTITGVIDLVVSTMLNAGTTALPYQPYFKGLKNAYFEKIVSTGKNLFGLTAEDFKNGTIDGAGKRVNLKLMPNTQYTLSSNAPMYEENATSIWFNGSNSLIDGVWVNQPRTATTDANGNLYITIRLTEIDTIFNNYWVMLNVGTTALPYEPYKQSVLSLPSAVENPAYNTLDFQTGKNVSEGATKIFDGTEAWGVYSTADYYIYTTSIPIYGFSQFEGIANKDFTFITPNVTTPKGCYIAGSGNNTFNVWFKVTEYPEFDTVDKWKAYLAAQYAAGDPLVVRYKTAEVQSETDLNASSDRYLAWKGGSETVVQGGTDNIEYGAEDTVTQEYFTITGGTANGN